MADHKRVSQKNQEEVDQKHRITQQESQPLFDQFHAWELGTSPVTETPLPPRMNQHAAFLSRSQSDNEKSNLVLHLQQTYGNRYVQRLLNSLAVQAKLTVSHPDDIYEQEADRVADLVTQQISTYEAQRQEEEEEAAQAKPLLQRQEEEEEVQTKSLLQRQEEGGEEEEEEEEEVQAKSLLQRQEDEEEETQAKSLLQRQEEEEEEETPVQTQAPDNEYPIVSGEVEARINSSRGSGQPLSDTVREPMEHAFGSDFNDVHVHTDSEANELNQQLSARAFTTGQDIYFREGEYHPDSDSGQKLIAHELTHVVQQTGRHQPQRQVGKKKATTADKSVNFGSRKLESVWDSNRRVEFSNPFASRALQDKVQVEAAENGPGVQRYKRTANWFTGLFTGKRVKLNSSITSVALAKTLRIKKDATDLEIGSEAYTVNGSVEAKGRADQVGLYKVGFLQTVYDSRRIFYYSPPKPGFLARLIPRIFGNRTKVTDMCSQLPVRDGDAGVTPWYGMETVKSFAAAKTSTKATDIYDRPTSSGPWERKVNGKTQYLVKTSGRDVFRTWLTVQNTSDNALYHMNYVDWKVDYGADVTVNKGSPASSAVTPTTGGAQIMGFSEGPGGKRPLTTDPVANDVATDVEGRW